MIDIDELTPTLFRRAAELATLDDRRLARELQQMQENAAAAFVAAGDDELSAWFNADAVVSRLRTFVARHRDRGRR